LVNSVRLIHMKVELPQNLEDYVSELVHSSGYKGPDEVVLEALREHQLRRQGMSVTMTPELERLLDEGLESLEDAKTTDELRRRCRLPASAQRPNATWRGFFVLSLVKI
jgi:Arc/MetJ-type ribon-helix-helix transcriptional regulator